MKLDIINMATFYGCDRKGVEFGPKVLLENNLESILENCNHKINKIIDIPVNYNHTDKFKENKQIKYFDEILPSVKLLSDEVYKSYSENNFPLILGGDHSLSIGSLSGFSNFFEDTGVIWVDAHGDLNTPSTSPSQNAHGMPLACSLGEGHPKLTSLFKRKINPKNVFLFGIRSLDKGEKDFIINNEMHIYDTNSFNLLNHDLMISTLKKYVEKNKIKNFHLSFDIDAFDETHVPGTGTPVKNGLYIDEMKSFFDKLLYSVNIVSMDFVEFNPLLDKDNQTLNLCLDMLEFLFKRINK